MLIRRNEALANLPRPLLGDDMIFLGMSQCPERRGVFFKIKYKGSGNATRQRVLVALQWLPRQIYRVYSDIIEDNGILEIGGASLVFNSNCFEDRITERRRWQWEEQGRDFIIFARVLPMTLELIIFSLRKILDHRLRSMAQLLTGSSAKGNQSYTIYSWQDYKAMYRKQYAP